MNEESGHWWMPHQGPQSTVWHVCHLQKGDTFMGIWLFIRGGVQPQKSGEQCSNHSPLSWRGNAMTDGHLLISQLSLILGWTIGDQCYATIFGLQNQQFPEFNLINTAPRVNVDEYLRVFPVECLCLVLDRHSLPKHPVPTLTEPWVSSVRHTIQMITF